MEETTIEKKGQQQPGGPALRCNQPSPSKAWHQAHTSLISEILWDRNHENIRGIYKSTMFKNGSEWFMLMSHQNGNKPEW